MTEGVMPLGRADTGNHSGPVVRLLVLRMGPAAGAAKTTGLDIPYKVATMARQTAGGMPCYGFCVTIMVIRNLVI